MDFFELTNFLTTFLADSAYSSLGVAYVNSHYLINRRSMIYCRVELFVVYGSSSGGINF